MGDRSWCIRDEKSSFSCLRYLIFRHEKIGTVLELDESSLGNFRCCCNDFEHPFLVTKYGKLQATDDFCMPDTVAGLRTNQIPGNVLPDHDISFGNWNAAVKDKLIFITNSFASCSRFLATKQKVQPASNNFNIDLDGSLQIILTEDSVVFLGLSTSINIPPTIFRLSNGIPEPVIMSQDTASRFVADCVREGFHDLESNMFHEGVSRSIDDDSVGVIRRGMMSRTRYQNNEEARAKEYMKLAASTRIAAVNTVELSHLSNCLTQGLISEEAFQVQSDAIRKPSVYPSSCLRARHALMRSMYIHPESKEHFSEQMFPKWNQLTWSEKYLAAVSGRDAESVSSNNLNSQGVASSYDPELPKDKCYSKHFQEMMKGEISGGMVIASNSTRIKNSLLLRSSRVGKEIDQPFEECEICGRQCVIPGSGMCDRCKDFELEKDLLDIKEDTLKPDTYLGDSRALLRHPGFHQYIPVPLSCDQTMRLKIRKEWMSSGVEERRKEIANLAQSIPSQPVEAEVSAFKSPHGRISVQTEQLSVLSFSLGSTLLPTFKHSNSVNSISAGLEKLHPMIKSNRFEEVQALLLQASAVQQSSSTDLDLHEIIDKRDRFGNTPLITAVQQGHKKLCKLLISLKANTNSQNKEGNTPLHYAAMYGYHVLFDYLSKQGADDTVTNNAGKLCYQMSEPKSKVLFGKSLKYEGRKEEAQIKFPVLINRAVR